MNGCWNQRKRMGQRSISLRLPRHRSIEAAIDSRGSGSKARLFSAPRGLARKVSKSYNVWDAYYRDGSARTKTQSHVRPNKCERFPSEESQRGQTVALRRTQTLVVGEAGGGTARAP